MVTIINLIFQFFFSNILFLSDSGSKGKVRPNTAWSALFPHALASGPICNGAGEPPLPHTILSRQVVKYPPAKTVPFVDFYNDSTLVDDHSELL